MARPNKKQWAVIIITAIMVYLVIGFNKPYISASAKVIVYIWCLGVGAFLYYALRDM